MELLIKTEEFREPEPEPEPMDIPDTLKKLNEAERARKDLEQQEDFDPKWQMKSERKEMNSLSNSNILRL